MESLNKTLGIQLGSVNCAGSTRKKRTEKPVVLHVGLLMPHKQLLNLIICLTPFKINSELSSYKRAN